LAIKKNWKPFYGTELLLSTMYGGPFWLNIVQ